MLGASGALFVLVIADFAVVLSDLMKPPSMRASMFVSSDGSNLSPGVPILDEMIVYMICLTLFGFGWRL